MAEERLSERLDPKVRKTLGFFGERKLEQALQRSPTVQALITKRRQEEAIAKGEEFTKRKFGELIGRQEKSFQDLSRQFAQNLNFALGQRLQQARFAAEQDIGRRGLAFSGIEQARLGGVAAAGQQAFAQSLGEFQTQLAQFQAQEQAAFARGEFVFITDMHKMGLQFDFDSAIMKWQAQIAADQASSDMWGGIFQGLGTIAGFGLGGLLDRD